MNTNKEIKSSAFNEKQNEAVFPTDIQFHYWQSSRSRIIKEILSSERIDNLKFIEIGCNKGLVVEYLNKENVAVDGVELADIPPIDSVKDKIISNTSFHELTMEQKNKYTGILLFDVIEHIEDPDAFIKSILLEFKNAQHIIITVPAMKSLWSNYDIFLGHYRRYNTQSLQELALATNTTLIKSGYFFHLLYPLGKLLLAIKKERPISISAPQTRLARFLHKVVAFCFYIEYKLLNKKIPGSSVYCHLKR